MFEKLEELAKNNKKISDFHIRTGSPLAYRQTGEIYKDEEALKAANIPEEDVRRDVKVIMPPLDLFSKTK